MKSEEPITRKTLASTFLISLAALADEILLTRIFSVTMWYHFAFGAISLAMFGMTVGSLQVFQRPGLYTSGRVKAQMSKSCLWFSITAVISVVAHMIVPWANVSIFAVAWITMSFCFLSVPFYFSGICICLALTKFPGKTGALYASDLAGAGCGCILVIYALKVTDAPTSMMVVGIVGAFAGLLLAFDGAELRLTRAASALLLVLVVLAVANGILASRQLSPIRVMWAKGQAEPRPLYERWNSFSRITVSGDVATPTSVISEGISPAYPESAFHRQLYVQIDGDAETTITAFDGSFSEIDYLQHDVKSVVHQVRSGGKVLIIGAGGGRDVLSALSMGQSEVRAVEINRNILDTLNRKFGDFSGHLDRNPKVQFVNDEARSYIARTDEKFDVIEASFIDTWAATAAGALTLAENSLYTSDAWTLFLNRLTPAGILSFSRWYPSDAPGEAYRLTSLAAESLRRVGVNNPRRNLVLLRNQRRDANGAEMIGAATLLLSRTPFSSSDLARIQSLALRLSFEEVLSPDRASDPILANLADGMDATLISRGLKLDISPPTDDRPFFFNLKPFRYLFHAERISGNGGDPIQSGELIIVLLFSVLCLSAVFIVFPVIRSTTGAERRGSAPVWLYFVAIGLGFMLLEVSQMQRFIVFLGHPTYALSVVLFTLLLSGGMGSWSTSRLATADRAATLRLAPLCAVLLIFGLTSRPLILAFSSSTTPIRIAVAAASLFPLGFFLGMPLPLGLKLASSRFGELTPAFWGINGAASIFGSILGMFIAIYMGISATFWTGCICYVAALALLLWETRPVENTALTPETVAAALSGSSS